MIAWALTSVRGLQRECVVKSGFRENRGGGGRGEGREGKEEEEGSCMRQQLVILHPGNRLKSLSLFISI